MSAVAAPQHAASAECEAARLFEAHSELLFGYCFRRLGSSSDAEDAVQTTFLYAFRALRRGVVPESEAAWLTAIAKNACLWQLRTRSRRGSLTSDIDLDRLASASQVDGGERELCHDLTEALAAIPENQRRALVLSEWHGLSSSEVASHLGLSTPATDALLTRARHGLSQALTALPQRAALGLAMLAFDVRSYIKTLFGGATKSVATASVVAAVAVAGVSVQTTLDREGSAPSPTPRAPAAQAVGTSSIATVPADGRKTRSLLRRVGPLQTEQRDRGGETIVGANASRPTLDTIASPSGGSPAAESAGSVGDKAPTASQDLLPELPIGLPELPIGLPELPLDPSALPAVDVPTEVLPSTELPPVPPLPLPPVEELPVSPVEDLPVSPALPELGPT